jgi:hypothetical protein
MGGIRIVNGGCAGRREDSFDGWLPLACMRDLGLGIVFMFLLFLPGPSS